MERAKAAQELLQKATHDPSDSQVSAGLPTVSANYECMDTSVFLSSFELNEHLAVNLWLAPEHFV